MHAAGRGVEAPDVMYEAGGIDERMFVRAGHLDAVIVVGNVVLAHGAYEAALVGVTSVTHRSW